MHCGIASAGDRQDAPDVKYLKHGQKTLQRGVQSIGVHGAAFTFTGPDPVLVQICQKMLT